MKTKARIYQLIGSREDGVLLNSDLTSFGRRSQVTAALLELCANGWIECIEQDVYVLPVKLTGLNGKTLLDRAHQRQGKHLDATLVRRSGRITATARYVSTLAKKQGVIHKRTFCDRWASAITRLAGDEITLDATDDLLVALTRNGALSASELVELVMNHHRELKTKFDCFRTFESSP